MMRIIIFLLCISFCRCSNASKDQQSSQDSSVITAPGAQQGDLPEVEKDTMKVQMDSSATSRVYENERFKDVRVKRTGEGQYVISGKAQIFEASFSWTIEDGHEELKAGHEMTDAGAPAWGNFSFTVNVDKKRPHSTLQLILYETSAKDGSRQHELPLLLY